MTKIPLHIAEKLRLLRNGEILTASSVKHTVIEELIAENIVQRNGRVQKRISLVNVNSLTIYLQNKFGINDLDNYISTIQKENLLRGESIEISGNSKLKKVRTFKGFLVDCYTPLQSRINGKSFILNPTEGIFQFIYDFETFEIPADITIVGIENPENFRQIDKQKYLFEDIKPLFVSRYPQNQSKDLIKWLQSIPNKYLHFGDFDFAGIGIYLNEYKNYLRDRASFFVPDNIEYLFEKHGNKTLYDNQKMNFDKKTIDEIRLLKLIEIIHKYKKGLEQEIFINNTSFYGYKHYNDNKQILNINDR